MSSESRSWWWHTADWFVYFELIASSWNTLYNIVSTVGSLPVCYIVVATVGSLPVLHCWSCVGDWYFNVVFEFVKMFWCFTLFACTMILIANASLSILFYCCIYVFVQWLQISELAATVFLIIILHVCKVCGVLMCLRNILKASRKTPQKGFRGDLKKYHKNVLKAVWVMPHKNFRGSIRNATNSLWRHS